MGGGKEAVEDDGSGTYSGLISQGRLLGTFPLTPLYCHNLTLHFQHVQKLTRHANSWRMLVYEWKGELEPISKLDIAAEFPFTGAIACCAL
jgi:hypothetical protein